jgi:hypothetical protein
VIANRIVFYCAAILGGLALSSSLRGQEAVEITTDPARVAGCATLGAQTLSDPKGLDLLRAEAARRGANVLRLTQLSERGISAELYRCGNAALTPSLPPPTATKAPTATPVAMPTPVPTAVPTPTRKSSKKATPVPPSTAERQHAAQEELASLKAAVVIVSDLGAVDGCEQRGEVKRPGTTEDSLREEAVGLLANVVLVRRAEDGTLSGQLYRCPRAQYQRLLAVTPPPVR